MLNTSGTSIAASEPPLVRYFARNAAEHASTLPASMAGETRTSIRWPSASSATPPDEMASRYHRLPAPRYVRMKARSSGSTTTQMVVLCGGTSGAGREAAGLGENRAATPRRRTSVRS